MQFSLRRRDGAGGFLLPERPAPAGEQPVRGDAVLQDQVGKPLHAEDSPAVIRRLLGKVPAIHAKVAADAALSHPPGQSQVLVSLEPAILSSSLPDTIPRYLRAPR